MVNGFGWEAGSVLLTVDEMSRMLPRGREIWSKESG